LLSLTRLTLTLSCGAGEGKGTNDLSFIIVKGNSKPVPKKKAAKKK
jgi:hypothetical protein